MHDNPEKNNSQNCNLQKFQFCRKLVQLYYAESSDFYFVIKIEKKHQLNLGHKDHDLKLRFW